jgi:hypothetical protein
MGEVDVATARALEQTLLGVAKGRTGERERESETQARSRQDNKSRRHGRARARTDRGDELLSVRVRR